MERFDAEQVIRILGLEMRAELADEGGDFDVACRIAIDKLRKCKEYEDLEEQGLLPRFPCKVGDIVYFPDESINYVFPITIAQIIISDLGEGKYCVQYNGCFFNGYGDPERNFEFETDDFGKTVFLTQAEAEEALKRMEREE